MAIMIFSPFANFGDQSLALESIFFCFYNIFIQMIIVVSNALTAQTAQTAQTEEFLFQNVAY